MWLETEPPDHFLPFQSSGYPDFPPPLIHLIRALVLRLQTKILHAPSTVQWIVDHMLAKGG